MSVQNADENHEQVQEQKLPDESNQSILFQLRQWRSFITPRASVIVLYIVGFLFIGLGTTFFVITGNNADYEIRYDDECEGKDSCYVWLNTTSEISGKISLAYKLSGFFQNHRRVFESRSYPQLAGEMLDYDGLSICDPIVSKDDQKDIASLYAPCGLMPLSFFNDTYQWPYPHIANFTETDISLESDRKLFKGLNSGYSKSIRWLDSLQDFPGGVKNEHFIVWMRTAALPTFMKTYERCIGCTIPKGNYTFTIENNYPTSLFNGEKHIVMSTVSFLGGKNDAIGISYMVVGAFLLLSGIIVLVSHIFFPRKLGDASYLNIVTGR